jgi:hypothetical protein
VACAHSADKPGHGLFPVVPSKNYLFPFGVCWCNLCGDASDAIQPQHSGHGFCGDLSLVMPSMTKIVLNDEYRLGFVTCLQKKDAATF